MVEQWNEELPNATVRFGEYTYQLVAGGTHGELTFGRATNCTVRLNPDDLGISRVAGAVVADGGTWWVVNRSARRPLAMIDEHGFRSMLAPGRRLPAEGRVRVVVDGSSGSHRLEINGPVRAVDPTTSAPGLPTAVGEGVLVSHDDRRALVALFAGYLHEGARHDPHPRTYRAAAARVRCTETALRRRIEYLRERLAKAGVPNMNGANALPNLAEYVLATGIVTKDDLGLIHL